MLDVKKNVFLFLFPEGSRKIKQVRKAHLWRPPFTNIIGYNNYKLP